MDSVNHFSQPGAGRAKAMLGTSMIYKAEVSQTGGKLVCAEITVPPGQGVPPHRHDAEGKALYVLSGRVVIEGDGCEGRAVCLDADSFFYGPHRRVHEFRCAGAETARLLAFVTSGTGLGAMFTDLAGRAYFLIPCGFAGSTSRRKKANAGTHSLNL